jgi:hypothetical protein
MRKKSKGMLKKGYTFISYLWLSFEIMKDKINAK